MPILDDAIEAVRDHFDGHSVEAVSDGAGGYFVTVSDVRLGPKYIPDSTWLGFHVNAAYPMSDVYPHYLGVVVRADGSDHCSAVQPVTWREKAALQLSRRSNGWNPMLDNAALKAEKVLTWFVDL